MKNILISGVIGLIFMSGGFVAGMKLMPAPPKPAPAPVAETKPVDPIVPPKDPISVEDLRKTSESMMTLTDALKAREQQVAAREQRVREKEDELTGERNALDSSHTKFKALFGEFQQRLELVEASKLDQLHKEADLYGAMNGDQAVDLVRAKDDASITQLFSVMDVKPLAKLVTLWKTKYPADAKRLMHALDDMAKVLPKDKIALSDPSLNATSALPAAEPAPAPVETAAPTTTPASYTPTAAPAPVPVTPPLAPPPDATAPAAAPAPAPAGASAAPATDTAPAATITPDLTTPGATAATAVPDPDNALPSNPVPVASPADATTTEHRAPRALPVTITTATTN